MIKVYSESTPKKEKQKESKFQERGSPLRPNGEIWPKGEFLLEPKGEFLFLNKNSPFKKLGSRSLLKISAHRASSKAISLILTVKSNKSNINQNVPGW